MSDKYRELVESIAEGFDLSDRQKRNLHIAIERLQTRLDHIPTDNKDGELTIDGKDYAFCEICLKKITFPPSETTIIWGHCFHHSCFVRYFKDNPRALYV